MRIATWNVNGIRARENQLREWLDGEQPDIVCLQEIKATPLQIPPSVAERLDYWSCWHGLGGYSGVALMAKKSAFSEQPEIFHPPFDFETRVVCARTQRLTAVSVYVPNGGKDFAAKIRFLESLERFVSDEHAAGHPLVICGDLNVALTDRDVHPKEQKPNAIGQLPEERQLLQRILDRDLTDVARRLDPDNENLFTWWPPWRNMRQRNIGWRIDYILASRALADTATGCITQRETGTSDHAPVIASFGIHMDER